MSKNKSKQPTEKRKYFAYLHSNNHWVIKKYREMSDLLPYFEDAFAPGSDIKGLIMPFEVEEELTEREIKAKENGEKFSCYNANEILKELPFKKPKALEYIQEMIKKLDWNKY